MVFDGKFAQQAGLAQPSGQMNILLLGSDQRPWDTIFRTDTVILATFNRDLGTVNLTSFPRDLYVTLPGWGTDRINTAYERGGFRLFGETFTYKFGVKPDNYVLINFSSFKQVIEKIGGLDVNVGKTVSDYRNGYWYTMEAGKVHMDADDVLWYVRTRKTSNDFARTQRQQEVLRAIIEKMLTMETISHAPELYEIYKGSVTTDLTFADILPWLPLGITVMDTSRIHQYFIGPEQTYDWITYEGAMVLLPRQDAIAEIMRQALNTP